MISSASPLLLSITALARSGSIEQAWRRFAEAGLDEVFDDPAVLSVRGRLLKGRAQAAAGRERARLYGEAALAYAEAGALGDQTYPLINAASLSLLAGRAEEARGLASLILERGEDELETPYYRAATRAEALLLLGREAQAEAAFAKAIARAPRAFEDHASTLRQFTLILEELGVDKAWLDAYRPPNALHFAGHIALASDENSIRRLIDGALEQSRVGFAYGALAAGADILIAEALVERDAELHLVLPAGRSAFRQASVSRFGAGWEKRYDALLERAVSVRALEAPHDDATNPLSLQAAAQVAMGRAVMQAGMMMTHAVQLVVLDEADVAAAGAGSTAWMAEAWRRSGRTQRILRSPRAARARSAPHAQAGAADGAAAAMLLIRLGAEADAEPPSTGALMSDVLPRIAAVIRSGPAPLVAPRWTGPLVSLALSAPGEAADAALAILAALDGIADVRIAAHFGVVGVGEDPLGGPAVVTGGAVDIPGQILLSAPKGAIHVSEDFAAVLHCERSRELPRMEWVGELPSPSLEDPIRLYSLTA
jgi:hypothetical protein